MFDGASGQSSSREERLEMLLEQARTLEQPQRDQLLAELANQDPDLHDELIQLLAVHDRQHQLLDTSIFAALLGGPDDADANRFIGRTIDNMTITHHLDTGGMGMVFQATRHDDNCAVAIKLMRPEILSRQAIQRFMAEAEMLSVMKHPGIASIYSLGAHQDNGRSLPYFVMELIPDAMPVTEYIVTHQLPIDQRLALFEQICDAVQYGHHKSVIHRDIKPSNVLMTSSAAPADTLQPKVIDFGIARWYHRELDLTNPNTYQEMRPGSIRFMSPEQCQVSPLAVDHRTDVYALGVLLFHMICETHPYELNDRPLNEIIEIITTQEPRRPREVCPGIDGPLERIMMMAMEKDPDDRYQTVAALKDDVHRYRAAQPVIAHRPTWFKRSTRYVQRQPWLASSVMMVLAVVIVIALLSQTMTGRSPIPFDIQMSSDSSQASLLCINGSLIRSWTTQHRGFSQATLLRSHQTRAHAGTLAVLAYRFPDTIRERGAIEVFDLSNPDNVPIWRSRVTDDEVMPELLDRGFRGDSFSVIQIRTINIFPDIEGEELLVIYRNGAYSHCLVRIYDTTGKVLQQFWHDGVLSDVQFLPDVPLLVFTGYNSEVYWHHRGQPDHSEHFPSVVFGVRPKMESIAHGWVTTTPTDRMVEPVWYQHITLPSIRDRHYAVGLTSVGGLLDFDHAVVVSVKVVQPERSPTLRLVLNENGELVQPKYLVHDSWRLAPNLPAPELFTLADIPPILEQYKANSGPGRTIPPKTVMRQTAE